jgi:hypothetical protein
MTLGDLAMRVGAAWGDVESYQVSFNGESMAAPPDQASPIASPVATPGATPVSRSRTAFATMREVVLPDRQRQQLTGVGADDHEAIAIGDRIYIRGPLVTQIAPNASESTWIEVESSQLPAGSVLTGLLGGLPQAPAAPLSSIPERLLPQPLSELGQVEFDGRECQVYGAVDTVPATGMRVDYAIAVDSAFLPCYIETSPGGVSQGRFEYRQIDAPLEIEAPTAATPVSVPPALATPAVHD